MTTLLEHATPFKPAIGLNSYLSRSSMRRLRFSFGSAAALFVTASALAVAGQVPYPMVWYGAALISSALWLDQIMLYSYHNHWYFAGIASLIGKEELHPSAITYEVASVVLGNPDDLVASWLQHPLGSEWLRRLGVDEAAAISYLQTKRIVITATEITPQQRDTYGLQDLGRELLTRDQGLSRWLQEQGVEKPIALGAWYWVIKTHWNQRFTERWWAKDNLLRTRGVGRDWSYGHTPLLNQFQSPLLTSAVYSRFANAPIYALQLVDKLEETLSRAKASNVLLIGEAGVGKMDIVVALSQRITSGKSSALLNNRQVIVLNTERLLSLHEEQTNLERTFISVLQEAARAGNIILVIENFSSFIKTAEEHGLHVPDLLDQYLADPNLLFIVTDTPGGYHNVLQPQGALVRRFGEVVIDKPDQNDIVRILEDICMYEEKKQGVFVTYPALLAIAEGADRYIVKGVPPDTAITLMIETVGHAKSHNISVVKPKLVYSVLQKKTGIPVGPIDNNERYTLLHLEETLHARVVGQDAAISAIANTLRRARVGIQTSTRPIGSFLFLGPTGVGKTETAKTLAEVFFNSADNMVRFDMSEYSGPQALMRMIGTQDSSGSLSDALLDHPYTVLLLDELEKAHQTIHDLFLQILDEGVFTDGRGQQINARNTIIIATSNAGSDLIYKTRQQREVDPTLNQRIIDGIIEQHIFRPELINRFDNTIIFEALKQSEQKQVGGLMLSALVDRMLAQGYHLEFEPDVETFLLEHGYSETFGARALRREIQDTFESVIAAKIISDGLQPGANISLSVADLKRFISSPEKIQTGSAA